ncbi:MAG: hypothetical protein KIS92_19870 [Planctomycetota bacterium]|nr:hypothetical protein [Planctomycetota bacterium]
MDMVDLDGMNIHPIVLGMIPAELARTRRVLPINMFDSVLTVVLDDSRNVAVLDDLRFVLNTEVEAALCTPAQFDAALLKYYPAA